MLLNQFLLSYIIWRSSPKTRARNTLVRFVPVLHFLLLKSKGEFSYLEFFCGVLFLLSSLYHVIGLRSMSERGE
ncbi:Cytochrome c biogenesis CcmF C-terminal-like mitochondrial protein [Linum perenne]